MTIVYNGTLLTSVVYEGTTLEEVYYGGTKVYGIPEAPTIGTATTTGTTTATVTFTPGADYGYSSYYTCTSTPGSISLNFSGSPASMTGLSPETSYTFKVKALNSVGYSSYSADSNSITTDTPWPPTTIGEAAGGGYYAGRVSMGGTQYYLILAPKSSGETTGKKWGLTGYVGGTSVIDGSYNSATLASLGSDYDAATWCESLTVGGYTDWYLPSLNELEVCYYFLKPGTTVNDTSSGANAYAVSPEPVLTPYSAGSPAQTSVALFTTSGAQRFYNDLYFTSTEADSSNCWAISFIDGRQVYYVKTLQDAYVRAMRRVAV